MFKSLHFYINFDWEQYIDREELYLKDIKLLVDSVYMHKASVYYSNDQLQEFVSIISNLDSNFIQSKGNILASIIRNSLPQEKKKYLFNISFNYDQTSLTYIPNLPIKQNEYIAILSSNRTCYNSYLLYAKNMNEIDLLKIDILHKSNLVFSWIQRLHTRNFNKSDKHGENGKGNWPRESCLLCSSEDAQGLLNTSIPDLEQIEERLFNYDPIHQTYIEFFYEGDNPQRQWHGFHLEVKDWKRVPESVRLHFGK